MAQQKTHDRDAVFAEEALVVDVQAFLHRMMLEKGVSRSQLAQAMGVSKARITQIFSDECKNFTIRLLARAVHALGERVEITSPCCKQRLAVNALCLSLSQDYEKWTFAY